MSMYHAAEVSRYYYSRLTGDRKIVYKAILSGIRNFTDEIEVPIVPINEIPAIFRHVLLDNPLIFYVSHLIQVGGLHGKGNIVKPEYKYTCRQVEEKTDAIAKYLQVFDAVKAKSDIDKEIHVHDYCLNNFSYDDTLDDCSFTVIGPVFNGAAVCEGIAKFVKLAFDYLGVKSLVVCGEAKDPSQGSKMESHAWNIVKMDGKAYHLDVTFDMSLTNRINRYDYFNLPDEEIKKDHVITGDVPVCSTTGKDYFSVNSLLAHSPSELTKHIRTSLKCGRKDILVKLMNVRDAENIVGKVTEIIQKQYKSIYKNKGGVAFEIRYNPGQMVFEIKFNDGGSLARFINWIFSATKNYCL